MVGRLKLVENIQYGLSKGQRSLYFKNSKIQATRLGKAQAQNPTQLMNLTVILYLDMAKCYQQTAP